MYRRGEQKGREVRRSRPDSCRSHAQLTETQSTEAAINRTASHRDSMRPEGLLPQASQSEQVLGRGRCLNRPVGDTQSSECSCPPPQSAPHERDRGRLAGELMAHRAANRTNAPEVDMRSPKTKQICAGDNTPCAVSIAGGIAGMQLDKNVAHGFRSDNFDSKLSQPHRSRQAKRLIMCGGATYTSGGG